MSPLAGALSFFQKRPRRYFIKNKRMIQISNSDQQQTVLIPASLPAPDTGAWALSLTSTVNRTSTALVPVSVERTTGKSYFVVKLGPVSLQEGEYEYRLLRGDTILSCSLAVVGEYKASRTTYNKVTEYEQYNG